MLINRQEVDPRYDVLTLLPLPDAKETLVWTTNIFIAADLSESRQPLSAYPAITIVYNFELGCGQQSFLTSAITNTNKWLIPYMPHFARGNLEGNELQLTSVSGDRYPYKDYCLVWNNHAMVYRQIAGMTDSTINLAEPAVSIPLYDTIINSGNFWVAPCFFAFIDPAISYTDVGPHRAESTIALKFRLTGDSEQALTYQSDDFDFSDVIQTPINVQAKRNQVVFAPPPAPADSFSPYGRMPDTTPVIEAKYRLFYDDYLREDYGFRGIWFKGQGAYTAGHYTGDNHLYRLSDDMISIEYSWGVSVATARLREVAG